MSVEKYKVLYVLALALFGVAVALFIALPQTYSVRVMVAVLCASSAFTVRFAISNKIRK